MVNTKKGLMKNVLLIVGAGLLFFACATKPDVYLEMDNAVLGGSFADALTVLEKGQESKKPFYPEKNRILLQLDKGILEHYAEKYDASANDLEEGERLIEEAFTKSVSQEVTSYIANDNTKDYPGEDYEDIYVNVFNALNYYHRGDLEGAVVEIRKVNIKLQALADKYAAGGSVIKEFAKKQVESLIMPDEEPVTLTDSALARYIGGLFYRGDNRLDDARIDFEEIEKIYAAAPGIYSSPRPASIDEELNVPSGMARLNVVAFAGLSPVKQENVLSVPIPLPSNAANQAKLALPQLVIRPSNITGVRVELQDGQSFSLDLIEDMESVAIETFKAKYALTFLKTITRVAIKAIAGEVATQAAEQAGGFGSLVSFGSKLAADASESADIRLSRYFPGKAYVGGITLDPGTYSFTVQFNDGSSKVFENVEVKAGALNLVEAVCLK
ncbi:MAG: hypothetical protein LBQ46_06955 [Treponema sp.]|jgi:hypothetical protein|nr:hypothetical protein [Treponema sp.]